MLINLQQLWFFRIESGWLTAGIRSRSADSDHCERVRTPMGMRVGDGPGPPEGHG